MNEQDLFKTFLVLLVGYLPTLLVSIVALALAAQQRHRAPEAARWAMLGFGLTLVLAVVHPLGQVLIQAWTINAYQSASNTQWAYGVLGIGGSVLQAVALGFLLVAIFAGRPRPGVPPPLPPV